MLFLAQIAASFHTSPVGNVSTLVSLSFAHSAMRYEKCLCEQMDVGFDPLFYLKTSCKGTDHYCTYYLGSQYAA
jgi:hypothetical protein